MAGLVWDESGKRLYENGVDRGVLYSYTNNAYVGGVAWNGLTGVEENPTGGEVSKVYADNVDYLSLVSVEEYGFNINAYAFPKEFGQCLGHYDLLGGISIGQQAKKRFGFSFRTKIDNDNKSLTEAYKIHLVYGCLAAPSSKSNSTVNDSPEAEEYSWEVSTIPGLSTPEGSTACVTIDALKLYQKGLIHVVRAIEEVIYGNAGEDPRLPNYQELIGLMSSNYILDSDNNIIYDSSRIPISSS